MNIIEHYFTFQIRPLATSNLQLAVYSNAFITPSGSARNERKSERKTASHKPTQLDNIRQRQHTKPLERPKHANPRSPKKAPGGVRLFLISTTTARREASSRLALFYSLRRGPRPAVLAGYQTPASTELSAGSVPAIEESCSNFLQFQMFSAFSQ